MSSPEDVFFRRVVVDGIETYGQFNVFYCNAVEDVRTVQNIVKAARQRQAVDYGNIQKFFMRKLGESRGSIASKLELVNWFVGCGFRAFSQFVKTAVNNTPSSTDDYPFDLDLQRPSAVPYFNLLAQEVPPHNMLILYAAKMAFANHVKSKGTVFDVNDVPRIGLQDLTNSTTSVHMTAHDFVLMLKEVDSSRKHLVDFVRNAMEYYKDMQQKTAHFKRRREEMRRQRRMDYDAAMEYNDATSGTVGTSIPAIEMGDYSESVPVEFPSQPLTMEGHQGSFQSFQNAFSDMVRELKEFRTVESNAARYVNLARSLEVVPNELFDQQRGPKTEAVRVLVEKMISEIARPRTGPSDRFTPTERSLYQIVSGLIGLDADSTNKDDRSRQLASFESSAQRIHAAERTDAFVRTTANLALSYARLYRRCMLRRDVDRDEDAFPNRQLAIADRSLQQENAQLRNQLAIADRSLQQDKSLQQENAQLRNQLAIAAAAQQENAQLRNQLAIAAAAPDKSLQHENEQLRNQLAIAAAAAPDKSLQQENELLRQQLAVAVASAQDRSLQQENAQLRQQLAIGDRSLQQENAQLRQQLAIADRSPQLAIAAAPDKSPQRENVQLLSQLAIAAAPDKSAQRENVQLRQELAVAVAQDKSAQRENDRLRNQLAIASAQDKSLRQENDRLRDELQTTTDTLVSIRGDFKGNTSDMKRYISFVWRLRREVQYFDGDVADLILDKTSYVLSDILQDRSKDLKRARDVLAAVPLPLREKSSDIAVILEEFSKRDVELPDGQSFVSALKNGTMLLKEHNLHFQSATEDVQRAVEFVRQAKIFRRQYFGFEEAPTVANVLDDMISHTLKVALWVNYRHNGTFLSHTRRVAKYVEMFAETVHKHTAAHLATSEKVKVLSTQLEKVRSEKNDLQSHLSQEQAELERILNDAQSTLYLTIPVELRGASLATRLKSVLQAHEHTATNRLTTAQKVSDVRVQKFALEEANFNQTVETLRNELRDAKNDVESKTKELSTLRLELIENNKLKQKMSAEQGALQETLDALRNDLESAKRDIEERNAELTEARKELKILEANALDLTNEKSRAETSILGAENERKGLEDSLRSAREQISNLEEMMKKTGKNNSELTAKVSSGKKKLKDLTVQLKESVGRVEELENQIASIRNESAKVVEKMTQEIAGMQEDAKLSRSNYVKYAVEMQRWIIANTTTTTDRNVSPFATDENLPEAFHALTETVVGTVELNLETQQRVSFLVAEANDNRLFVASLSTWMANVTNASSSGTAEHHERRGMNVSEEYVNLEREASRVVESLNRIETERDGLVAKTNDAERFANTLVSWVNKHATGAKHDPVLFDRPVDDREKALNYLVKNLLDGEKVRSGMETELRTLRRDQFIRVDTRYVLMSSAETTDGIELSPIILAMTARYVYQEFTFQFHPEMHTVENVRRVVVGSRKRNTDGDLSPVKKKATEFDFQEEYMEDTYIGDDGSDRTAALPPPPLPAVTSSTTSSIPRVTVASEKIARTQKIDKFREKAAKSKIPTKVVSKESAPPIFEAKELETTIKKIMHRTASPKKFNVSATTETIRRRQSALPRKSIGALKTKTKTKAIVKTKNKGREKKYRQKVPLPEDAVASTTTQRDRDIADSDSDTHFTTNAEDEIALSKAAHKTVWLEDHDLAFSPDELHEELERVKQRVDA